MGIERKRKKALNKKIKESKIKNKNKFDKDNEKRCDQIDNTTINDDYISLIENEKLNSVDDFNDLLSNTEEYDLYSHQSQEDISENEYTTEDDDDIIPKSNTPNTIEENKFIGIKAWGKNSSVYYNHDLQDIDMMQNDEDAQAVALLEEKECEALRDRLYKTLAEEHFTYIFEYDRKNKTTIQAGNTNKYESNNITNDNEFSILNNSHPLLIKLFYIQEKLNNEINKCNETKIKYFGANFNNILKEMNDNHKILYDYYTTKLVVCHEILLHLYYAFLIYPINENDNIDTFANQHPVFNQISLLLMQLKRLDNIENNNIEELFIDKIMLSTSNLESIDFCESSNNLEEYDDKNNECGITTSTLDNVAPLDHYYTLKSKYNNHQNSKKNQSNAISNISSTYLDNDRCITKEMERNRGLVKKSKREYKNPRVKHKLKYKKAVKRRIGQVRPIRKLTSKYDGESRGINSKVVHSVKLK